VVDLLGEDRGIRVPPRDEEAFAGALLKLAGDKQLRHDMGARGYEFVQRNYRKERLVEDIKCLYGELLNEEQVSEFSEVSRKGAKAQRQDIKNLG
jgi:glycosyltransferase involved in cell wall biosynthesis